MKQNKKNPQLNEGQMRKLTAHELKTIAGYKLHPKIEERVKADWQQYRFPRVTLEKQSKGKVNMIFSVIFYLLPCMLWIGYLASSYLDKKLPDITAIILTIAVILSWIVIVMAPFVFAPYLAMSKHIRNDVWNPVHLSIWKSMGLWSKIRDLSCWGMIVAGLIIHGYYVLSGAIFLYLLVYWGKYMIKNIVQMYMFPHVK